MPTVSVIIPTYDRAAVLGRAIDSVLAQTHEELELFVVDDGSTDATAAIVEQYDDPRVHYLAHEENRGAPTARNTGIEHATGEYVAFLDSDDEWRPRKLERQLDRLDALGEGWVAVYCDVDRAHDGLVGRAKGTLATLLHGTGADAPVEGGEELVADVLLDELHTHAGSTLLVKRAIAQRVGGFDESFERFQDPEFLIRVLREGKLAYVPESLVVRHESGDPPAETVEDADEHYLETFSATVRTLEATGHDVAGRHALIRAKAHLRDGDVLAGVDCLRRADVAPRQYPGLLWDGVSGQADRRWLGAVCVAGLIGLLALGRR